MNSIILSKFKGGFSYIPFLLLPLCFLVVMLLDDFHSLYSLITMVIISAIVFFTYLSVSIRDFELVGIIFILLITFYSMTILPGGGQLFQLSVVPVALFYLIWFIRHIDFRIFDTRLRSDSLFYLFFSLSLITLFSSVVLYNIHDFIKPLGFSKAISYLGSMFLFGHYVSRKLYENNDLYFKFIKGIILAGVISSVFGVITIFYKLNPMSTVPGSAISFFSHENLPTFLYTFTIPCTLYAIYFLKERLNEFQKVYVYLALALMILNVLFTFNRSGVISMMVGISILTFCYSRKLFVLFIVTIVPVFSFVMSFLLLKGAGTILARILLYQISFEMMNSSFNSFLFGFGIETNYEIFEKLKFTNMVFDSHNYPHNGYIFFILNFGFVPFLMVLLSLLILLFRSAKKIFTGKFKDKFLFLPFAVVVSAMVYSLFEDFFLFTDNFMYHLLLIFLGLLYLNVFQKRMSD